MTKFICLQYNKYFKLSCFHTKCSQCIHIIFKVNSIEFTLFKLSVTMTMWFDMKISNNYAHYPRTKLH